MNLREKRPFDPAFYNDMVEKDIHRLSSIWEELRSKAVTKEDDKGYLFGNFTALDAMYAPVMFRVRTYDLIPKVQGKHALAYIYHMLNDKEMQDWEELASGETEYIPRNELYPK